MPSPSAIPDRAHVCTPPAVQPRAADQVITVTFEISVHSLDGYTDEHIVQLWHISQANPAPFGDPQAGELAKLVGGEIIRRFVTQQPPALWIHQADNAQAKARYTNTGGAA